MQDEFRVTPLKPKVQHNENRHALQRIEEVNENSESGVKRLSLSNGEDDESELCPMRSRRIQNAPHLLEDNFTFNHCEIDSVLNKDEEEVLRGREFTFLKLQSCALADDNDREVQHFESSRDDLSSDIKSEDDDFSRDDNLNHGVEGLMNHFNLSQSLKDDSMMELKLPLNASKPIRIQEGIPLLS